MFWNLRLILLPMAAFFIVGGLAWAQWAELRQGRDLAARFHGNSRVVQFKAAPAKTINGRTFPTYLYVEDGIEREFVTHRELELPPDGRVRLGVNPDPLPANPFEPREVGEIAVPLNGADSVDTLHAGMLGHPVKDDVMKASVVTVAAVVTAIAAFFLQRLMFGSLRRTTRKW